MCQCPADDTQFQPFSPFLGTVNAPNIIADISHDDDKGIRLTAAALFTFDAQNGSTDVERQPLRRRGTYSSDPGFSIASTPIALTTPPSPRESETHDKELTLQPKTIDFEPKTPLIPRQSSPVMDLTAKTLPSLSKTLWRHFIAEVQFAPSSIGFNEADWTADAQLKWARVSNFLSIPFAVESTMLFGFLVCLDAFLYTFTLLPFRVFLILQRMTDVQTSTGDKTRQDKTRPWRLKSSEKADALKFSLFVLASLALLRLTDPSKIYHTVRGQDTIKLYVIFNAFEIGDRLCCAFGQDLLDSLFSRSGLSHRNSGYAASIRTAAYFSLSLLYVIAHTIIFLYQLVTLNVAINSYDNALLTLLISNQFVEIKGSVFKKFEKENLFQISCADIVERFQLALMLTIVACRNLVEMGGSELAFLPSFISSHSILGSILWPVMAVALSEVLVDWLKHAFISKFNHIKPTIYQRFKDVLAKDIVSPLGPQDSTNADRSARVTRRLGFAAIPLACLLVRIACQIWDMLADSTTFDECAAPQSRFAWRRGVIGGDGWQIVIWLIGAVIVWMVLVAFKIMLGISLLAYAAQRDESASQRSELDKESARGRKPIGESAQEQDANAKLSHFLNVEGDTSIQVIPRSSITASSKKQIELEQVDRYSLLKRIY